MDDIMFLCVEDVVYLDSVSARTAVTKLGKVRKSNGWDAREKVSVWAYCTRFALNYDHVQKKLKERYSRH